MTVVIERVVYPPASQFAFRAGPYVPPSVAKGTVIHDVDWGDVEVAGMTKTPIPWPGFSPPRGRHKGLMPILFDGLVRAVVEEERAVVAHYWGVTPFMVNKWRKAVAGCSEQNEVFTTLALMRMNSEFRAKYGYV
jgi:hypothetical protein